jgi:hypothetical protein
MRTVKKEMGKEPKRKCNIENSRRREVSECNGRNVNPRRIDSDRRRMK